MYCPYISEPLYILRLKVERCILIWHWTNSSRLTTVLNQFSTLIYNPPYGRNTPYQPVHNHIFGPSWSFTFEPEFGSLCMQTMYRLCVNITYEHASVI